MRRALLGIVLLVCASFGAEPVRVIMDTDLGPDCDDAGAIALLHTMAARGEARALAIMCNTTSERCAPAVDAIDTYYGRPDVPVGTLTGPGNPGGSESWNGREKNYDGGRIRPHSSCDQTALLYAVWGPRDYWTARTGGVNRFFDDGTNEWLPRPDRGHVYLIVRMPPDTPAGIIEEMMTAAAAR